jgi:hypothetical protein
VRTVLDQRPDAGERPRIAERETAGDVASADGAAVDGTGPRDAA